jgi:DNA-binding response OmpR family regulator
VSKEVVVTARGLRTLVVDDFQDAALVTQMLLEMQGHTCRIAVSGGEALMVATEFDPELVILDLGLPDISGFEVARTLRARWGGKPLYLAAVTGWGDQQTRIRALAAGFDQHVLKPTDTQKLRGIMQSASFARLSA